MDDFNTQMVEFGFAFPSKIFQEELKKRRIGYRPQQKDSFQRGMGSAVFYIRSSDFEKALEIREKVDRENASVKSRLK